MQFFQTIKAKILALLILAMVIVGLNAGVTGYTNRLKAINGSMSQQASAIQVTVLENLMLEAQYISSRKPELLKRIAENDARFNQVLVTIQALSGNTETRTFIETLDSAYKLHQSVFKQISISLAAFDEDRKKMTQVNSQISDTLVSVTKNIEEKATSASMLGDDLPQKYNTLMGLVKDMLISLNINDRILQNLLVGGPREEYDQRHDVMKNEMSVSAKNIQSSTGTETGEYKGQWDTAKDNLTLSYDLEATILTRWDESRQLEKDLEAAVFKVQKLAESLYQTTEKQIAHYNRIGTTLTLTVLAVGLVAFIIIGALIANSIVKPINNVVNSLKDVAEGEGDLTKRLDVKTRGEVGELARWFNVFVEKIQKVISEVAQNAGELSDSSVTLAAISTEMAKGAEETSLKAKTVADNAEEMSSNITSVSAATEQTATNMSMVASAAEEMTATINEISSNTENARQITEEAVAQTAKAKEQIVDLGKAAKQIERVIETITDISEQVSLLSLNATIEAARAGEAGKGFAVVANEIKELAKQTAGATGEIRQNVEAIQTSTAGTVTAIGAISQVVESVNQIVSTISAAIEEQSITTRDIAENVAQASKGISEVNTNVAQASTSVNDISNEISMVTNASNGMSASSAQVNKNSMELSKLAQKLNEMVALFKV